MERDEKDVFLEAFVASKRLQRLYKTFNNNSLEPYIQINTISLPIGWSDNKRVFGLKQVVEITTKKDISIEIFPPVGPSSSVDAFLLSHDEINRIFVSNTRNYCWQRFLVAKELMHIVMQVPGNITQITSQSVERLISCILNAAPVRSQELLAEYVAYIAAIELLFPKDFVETAAAMVAEGRQLHDVALRFKVPRVAIEFRLREDIKSLFDELYQSSKYKNAEYSA